LSVINLGRDVSWCEWRVPLETTMRALIVYGTTESHAAASPRFVEEPLAAGAFGFKRHVFLKTRAMKRIAWRKGQTTVASRGHVLTDKSAPGDVVDKLREPGGPRPAAA
jgi:hypothetical protein